ncbi:patatin-like phospholipase family protein [Gordonia sp. CPCC 205333]|uniref:patatin-like phospholipase family protein n=1 Tax=Gordonia sp. CPCC 205333 TaxID=3140790 RepID=UPI003AF3AEF7
MNTISSPTPHTSTTGERSQSGRRQPIDATTRIPTGKRALILGGGGSTGNAWLIGVVAGIFDAGLDLTEADLIVGTSAGSTAAAQITCSTPVDQFAAVLDAPPQSPAQPVGPVARPNRAVADHLARMKAIISTANSADDMRRTMAAAALERTTVSDGSWQSGWRTTVAARLPSREWPEQSILITAVDARTGEPVLFDNVSGVDLADAVAASCASGLAYGIDDGLYIDGGYRSNAENADLASGYERVLVLSPFGGRSLHPQEWRTHLDAQVDGLRAGGSEVYVISPDSSVEYMFGANAMDISLRPIAAQVGYDQGMALIDKVGELWQ